MASLTHPRPIIHPRFVANQHRVRQSFVTVEEPSETRGTDYSVVTGWRTVAIARGMLALASDNENRTPVFTSVEYTHELDLDGYYFDVLITHRVMVSRTAGERGETFNIKAINHDSQATRTRLALDKVTH